MNGVLLINKPTNITSHGVVKHIRQMTKLKVGHTGTLDPQATGVLIVMLGSATKLSPYLNLSTKKYVATCQLGQKTDTGDIWGEVIEERKAIDVTQPQLEEILNSFLGESYQKTPMVSAAKIKGKKLYEYHREGQVIDTPLRKIEVYDISLLSINDNSFTFEATVSSGTYIRTLCEDIATKLETIGTMSALNRVGIGDFTIDQCIDLKDLTYLNWQSHLISKKDALTGLPYVHVNDPQPIFFGKPMEFKSEHDEVVVLFKDEVLAIYQRDENSNVYKSKRGLW